MWPYILLIVLDRMLDPQEGKIALFNILRFALYAEKISENKKS